MKVYKVKAFVEAEQFHADTLPWPEGVEKAKLQGDRRNVNGFWRIGDPIVRGVRGTIPLKDGDRVVKGPKGFFVVEEADFQNTYELVQQTREQAMKVAPLIGPLLDAWDNVPNDAKGYVEECSPLFGKLISELNAAMGPPDK